MKICSQCQTLHREQVVDCQVCRVPLREVTLREALTLTQQRALEDSIKGKESKTLPDAYRQYHIRCYLQDRSLFLDFDLHKNRLKHGRRLKRFFIAPIRLTTIFNLPWLFFNIISSNLFHLEYTEFCPHCETKFIKGRHTAEECDYNVEYFSILDDILNGSIINHRIIYEEYAKIRKQKGLRSAYNDLFCRPVRWEVFWDLVSVGSSVIFWLYLIVYISYPLALVFFQNIQTWDIAGHSVIIKE